MKKKVIDLLKWTEQYTGTDMVYAVKGSFWIVFGKVGLFFISFAKMFIFGKYADQEVYGVYAFILSMSAMLSVFSLPGINTSLIGAIAKKKDGTLDLAIKERFKFSLLGSLTSLMIVGWYIYNENQALALAFLAVAFFFPFQYVFPIFLSFWNGKKDFERSSKYELLSSILVATITIPVIIYTSSPLLIIIALFGSQSFFDGLLLLRTRKEKDNDEALEETISFGKNLTVMGAISAFVEQVDKVILWKFFGPAQLAIYSFAQLPIQKIEGAIPIGSLALPKIGERKFREIKDGIMKKFKKLFLIFAPITLTVILLAPLLYRLIFPQYIESIPYFQAFSLIILLSPFTLFSVSLVSEMKKKELYIIQMATPLFKIVLFLTLIPLFQIWGVVLAVVISRFFNGLLIFHFFRKI